MRRMSERRSDLGDAAFITIERVEDIPVFASEGEEHRFWETHGLSDTLWDTAEPFEPDELPAPRAPASPVVIHAVAERGENR